MKKLLMAAIVGTVAALAFAAPAQAAPPDNAVQNHVAYWEAYTAEDDTCFKDELPDGISSYTLPALPSGQVYTLLVLKAGSGSDANTLIPWPQADVPYEHSTGKDLSHAIYCVTEQTSS